MVLGGNGFIGKNLCNFLQRQGEDVTSFDKELPLEQKKGITYIEGDFFEDVGLREILEEHTIIYHAISTVNPGNSNETYMQGYAKDFIQTIKMCSWIKDRDKKVIFLSSGGTIYGNQATQPIKEDALPQPINHYGNIKLCVENTLRILHIQNKIHISIARISNPYGPEQDYTKGVGFVDAVLKRSIQKKKIEIWGDGETIRDYIYIDDVIKFLYYLSFDNQEDMIYNISSGIGISQNQIIDMVRKLGIAVEVEYKRKRSVDVEKIILDNSKIQKQCKMELLPFSDGIERYYQYLMETYQ